MIPLWLEDTQVAHLLKRNRQPILPIHRHCPQLSGEAEACKPRQSLKVLVLASFLTALVTADLLMVLRIKVPPLYDDAPVEVNNCLPNSTASPF